MGIAAVFYSITKTARAVKLHDFVFIFGLGDIVTAVGDHGKHPGEVNHTHAFVDKNLFPHVEKLHGSFFQAGAGVDDICPRNAPFAPLAHAHADPVGDGVFHHLPDFL